MFSGHCYRYYLNEAWVTMEASGQKTTSKYWWSIPFSTALEGIFQNLD